MGLLDTTMELAKVAGKIANPKLLEDAMKANSEALAISRENLDLHKRVTELEGQVRDLQAQKDLRSQLYVNGGYLYRDGDPHPYCLTCWDSTGKLIHKPQTNAFQFVQTCVVCKSELYEPEVKSPKRDHSDSISVL